MVALLWRLAALVLVRRRGAGTVRPKPETLFRSFHDARRSRPQPSLCLGEAHD